MRRFPRTTLRNLAVVAATGVSTLLMGCGSGIRFDRAVRVGEVHQAVGRAKLVNNTFLDVAMSMPVEDRRLRDRLPEANDLVILLSRQEIDLNWALGRYNGARLDRYLEENEAELAELGHLTDSLWTDALAVVAPDVHPAAAEQHLP